jgi:hypothetical protein
MSFRTTRLTLAAFMLLALSACSSSAGADGTPSGTVGTIDMAVSDTCIAGSDSQCVLVDGDSVLLPSTFREAGVASFSVAEAGRARLT